MLHELCGLGIPCLHNGEWKYDLRDKNHEAKKFVHPKGEVPKFWVGISLTLIFMLVNYKIINQMSGVIFFPK